MLYFFLLPLGTLLPSAQASDPLTLLREAAQGTPAPNAVISCGEIGEIVSNFQQSAAINLAAAAMETKLPNNSSGQQAKEWIRIVRSGGVDALGLDVEGSILFEAWEGENSSFRGTVPVDGTEEQIQDLMARIFGDYLEETEVGWKVRPKDPGAEPWAAALEPRENPGNLVFTLGVPDESQQRTVDILSGLESATGCYAYAHAKGEGPVPLGDMAMALTDNPDHPVLVRISIKSSDAEGGALQFPESLAKSETSPIGGSSTESPVAVFGLGVSPFELLEVPPIKEKLGPELSEQFLEAQDALQLPAGLTVAIFGNKQSPEPVVVIPILDRRGKAFRARRLNRLIQRGLGKDAPVERTARDAFTITRDSEIFYGRILPGKVIVGTDPTRVDESAFGLGTPWLTEADLAWGETWPVNITFRSPDETPVIAGNLLGRAGVRVNNGIVEMAIRPEDDQGRIATPALLGIVSAIAIPNFVTMQYRAKRSEIPANLSDIRKSLVAAEANSTTISSLPHAPRPLEALDRDGVEWTAGPEWEPLDWTPTGTVRASYWMDRLENGSFQIHGAADLDGNGELTRWIISSQDTEPTMLTGPDVY